MTSTLILNNPHVLALKALFSFITTRAEVILNAFMLRKHNLKVSTCKLVILRRLCCLSVCSLSVCYRFEQTYIGTVVVSVNPYKTLPIYNQDVIEKYRGENLYELAPHM